MAAEVEEDLTTYLLADSGISALVGARINWGTRVQLEALPAIRLTVISPGQDYTHSGAMTLTSPRVQIDCWAASPLSALSLKRAVVTAMHAIRSGVSGGGNMKGAFLTADRETDPEDLGGGNLVHRRIVDFFVWHQV